MEKTLEEKIIITFALGCLYADHFDMDVEEVVSVDGLYQLDSLAGSFVSDEGDAISITRELFGKYAKDVLAEARGREC